VKLDTFDVLRALFLFGPEIVGWDLGILAGVVDFASVVQPQYLLRLHHQDFLPAQSTQPDSAVEEAVYPAGLATAMEVEAAMAAATCPGTDSNSYQQKNQNQKQRKFRQRQRQQQRVGNMIDGYTNLARRCTAEVFQIQHLARVCVRQLHHERLRIEIQRDDADDLCPVLVVAD